MSARTKKRVAVVSASIMALALAGGVAAQFTASTTSAPQQIGTGTLSIDFQNESAGWTQDISNLAAGDTEITGVDFVNTGTLSLSDNIKLSVADSTTNGLSTDLNTTNATDDSLQVRISSDKGIAYFGPVSALFGDGQTIPAGLLGLGAGDSTHLTFAYTVPASAGNEYQGKGAHLSYTANASQRAASSFGDASDAGTGGNTGNTGTGGGGYSGPAITGSVMNTWSKAIDRVAPPADGETYSDSSVVAVGTKMFFLSGLYSTFDGYRVAPTDVYDLKTGTWSKAETAPALVTNSDTVVSGSQVYLLGGVEYTVSGHDEQGNEQYDQTLGAALRYDTASNTWTRLPDMPVLMNKFSSAVGSDGKVYVFGGETPGGGVNGDIYVYDPTTNAWTDLGAMPGKYTGGGVATIGDDIYYLGGLSVSQGGTPAPAVKYNVVTKTWTTLATLDASIHLYADASVGKDGRIYLVGGLNLNTYSPDNKVYAYNPATDSWSDTESTIPADTYLQHNTVDGEGNIYVTNSPNGDKAVYRLS